MNADNYFFIRIFPCGSVAIENLKLKIATRNPQRVTRNAPCAMPYALCVSTRDP
jgi:hypothetical protein